MQNPIDVVRKALTDRGLQFESGPEPDSLLLGFKGEHGQLTVVVHCPGPQRVLLMYTDSNLYIPEQRRRDAAEFVARANCGLPLGNLELDMNDGGVRYKVSADFQHGEPTEELVMAMLIVGVNSYSRYLPGLTLIATGVLAAEDAIVHTEMPVKHFAFE